MSSYVLSPRAQADLSEIWDFSALRWSEAQADRYIQLLRLAVMFVADDPRRGTSCDEIRPGYRKYLAGSHVIFYRLDSTGIDVVRILHASMDFERHL